MLLLWIRNMMEECRLLFAIERAAHARLFSESSMRTADGYCEPEIPLLKTLYRDMIDQ